MAGLVKQSVIKICNTKIGLNGYLDNVLMTLVQMCLTVGVKNDITLEFYQ